MILKHLRRYRSDWEVTVRAGRGKHSALKGLCHAVCHDQEPPPPGPFDTEATLGWYENYCRFSDRPNSKITNCLQEVFGLAYDASLGRYEIRLSAQARQKAADYLRSLGVRELGTEKFASVILHYEGNTSTWKKNVKHWQARSLIDLILRSGRVPVILDWDNRSPLPDQERIFCPRVAEDDIWGGFGSGDAEMIAALVHCSEAFIGIDSGPGKCASATGTPTLVIWKEHHPIQFHDPADNTTHLIPHNWQTVPPADTREVAAYFEKHYKYLTYHGEHGMVETARDWLAQVLQCPNRASGETIPFVTPNGIGDVLWTLHKIRSIAGNKPIDLILAGDPRREMDKRAIPFVKRFGFVRSVEVMDVPILRGERDEDKNDEEGRYRYVPDGERGGFYYLVPNTVLERGERLETWQPDHPTDWKVIDEFDWSGTERGEQLARALGNFVAFYLGPETGNVDEGHNRGFLWEPKHWVSLGRMLAQRGLRVALVGAGYDRSYWERYVRPGVVENGMTWHDLIGELEIGETMALLRRAKAFISYQCGLGIFAHYLGVPVMMWWRPEGDSIHPQRLVSFKNEMRNSWTNPAVVGQGKYVGLLYKQETPGDLMAEMERRGWLD